MSWMKSLNSSWDCYFCLALESRCSFWGSLLLFSQHPFGSNVGSLRIGKTPFSCATDCYYTVITVITDFLFILSGFESILEGLFGTTLLKDLSLFKGIKKYFWYFKFFLVTWYLGDLKFLFLHGFMCVKTLCKHLLYLVDAVNMYVMCKSGSS